jgi:N4-gp56 family major capsid protein
MPVTSTTSLTGLVAVAYDKAVMFAFQPQLRFAQLADAKRWNMPSQPYAGDTIKFTVMNDLTVATGTLSETADPAAVTPGKVQRTVTMYEYGNLVTTTHKLRITSFADIDLTAARLIGDNMGRSVDVIARAAFDGQTGAAYIRYGNTRASENLISTAAADLLNAADCRYAYNRLARSNVPFVDGMFYGAVHHPDCVHDLRETTGTGNWRQPKEYVDPAEIYNGEIGEFEGFRHVLTSQARLLANGGTGNIDTYYSYFVGF